MPMPPWVGEAPTNTLSVPREPCCLSGFLQAASYDHNHSHPRDTCITMQADRHLVGRQVGIKTKEGKDGWQNVTEGGWGWTVCMYVCVCMAMGGFSDRRSVHPSR